MYMYITIIQSQCLQTVDHLINKYNGHFNAIQFLSDSPLNVVLNINKEPPQNHLVSVDSQLRVYNDPHVPFDSLVVFYLCDDLDVLPFPSKDGSDVLDVLTASDEGRENHVHLQQGEKSQHTLCNTIKEKFWGLLQHNLSQTFIALS